MDSHILINFLLAGAAIEIIPSKRESQEQSLIVNEIKLLLERESKYCISKTKIAGSVGKATTIISSDVDVIIFVKEILPPFEDVLKDFENILRNATPEGYVVEDIHRTQHTIKFTVNNYEFDLLPAIDFVHEANIGADRQLILQQQRTLDKMKEDLPRNWSAYSSSLAFSTVHFMKRQSPFAHDMARLVKFWYKSACITDYVYGAKYAMELIAVKACTVVSRLYDENLFLAAFQKFLEDIQYFDCLDISFENEYCSLNGHKPPRNRMKPSILDPANPYNNLAKAFVGKPNALNALKIHAERTLRNIRGMQFDDGMLDVLNFTSWRIMDIFKPDLLCDLRKVGILVGSCTEIESQQYKSVEIRVDVSDDVRKKIEFMQICLTAICKQAPGDSVRERFKLVYKMKYPAANFVPASGEMHEDYDVTIALKIDNLGAALFSFDIPE